MPQSGHQHFSNYNCDSMLLASATVPSSACCLEVEVGLVDIGSNLTMSKSEIQLSALRQPMKIRHYRIINVPF